MIGEIITLVSISSIAVAYTIPLIGSIFYGDEIISGENLWEDVI